MSSAYDAITNKIIEHIEKNGTLPWVKPWVVRQPINAISGKAYRGINAVVLGMSDYRDHRWLTFKQAQDLGGNVRRGEKATSVILWKFATEEEILEGKSAAPLVRLYSVFNVEQCENLNLEELPESLDLVNVSERIGSLVSNYIDAPEIKYGGDRACYIPSADRIEMPNQVHFGTPEAFASVLAHELVHSTGSENRLQRVGVADPINFGSETYALEELIAEIGSAFVCSEIGIANNIDRTAAYVQGWLQALRNNKSMIVKAASQAQKAADYILGNPTSRLEQNQG